MDKTPQQMRDEVWASNTRSAYPGESVDAVRALREEDRLIDEMSWAGDYADDGRTPQEVTIDLLRALGLPLS